MSQSTQVKVVIGMIALEFTFGSRQIADLLHVELGTPSHFEGNYARRMLQDFQIHLPAFEASLIDQVLRRHDADFTESERVDYAAAFNCVRVTVTRFD